MSNKTASDIKSSKKSYQTPELTLHGSVEQLTESINDGHGSCLKVYKQPTE